VISSGASFAAIAVSRAMHTGFGTGRRTDAANDNGGRMNLGRQSPHAARLQSAQPILVFILSTIKTERSVK
jgi:hypothetical protein